METVEAIQANLEGKGIVLVPGTPDNPPEIFTDEQLFYQELRVFNKANPGAPVFKYNRNVKARWWELDNVHKSK